MTSYRLNETVDSQIDEIYTHSRNIWGEAQAKTYIRSLYAEFAAIADRRRHWRRLPAAFDVDGYFSRYERHLIYWRVIDDTTIGVVAILHERMQQLDRFREIIGSNDQAHPSST